MRRSRSRSRRRRRRRKRMKEEKEEEEEGERVGGLSIFFWVGSPPSRHCVVSF